MYKVTKEGNGTQEFLDILDRMPRAIETSLYDLATSVRKVTLERVEGGAGTEGELNITKSRPSLGRYSQRWGSKRQEYGKRIDVVTLNFEGDLFRDYSLTNVSSTSVTLGFATNEKSEIAETLETYYGHYIFDVDEYTRRVQSGIFFENVFNIFR